MLARINIPDFAFALFLIGLGALAFWLTGDLRIGTAAAMGPGYVPRALGFVLILFGIVMGARALLRGFEPFPTVALRPLLLVSAAVSLFAILLPLAGLAITSAAVVLCAGFAAYDARLRENALLALGLAVFAVLLFVAALGLPIRVWPW